MVKQHFGTKSMRHFLSVVSAVIPIRQNAPQIWDLTECEGGSCCIKLMLIKNSFFSPWLFVKNIASASPPKHGVANMPHWGLAKFFGLMETQIVRAEAKARSSCLLRSRRVLSQCLAVVHGLQGFEGAVGPAQLLLQGGQGQSRLQVLRCHFHHLGITLGSQLHAAESLQTLCWRDETLVTHLCTTRQTSYFKWVWSF